jgi:hypothetical protein
VRASQAITATYTAAQAATVLLDAGTLVRFVVTGVIFTAHADNTAKPSMAVSLGSAIIAKHPGVPAGGGLVAAGLDVSLGQGDDLIFDCDVPTGGSVTVTVFYRAGP